MALAVRQMHTLSPAVPVAVLRARMEMVGQINPLLAGVTPMPCRELTSAGGVGTRHTTAPAVAVPVRTSRNLLAFFTGVSVAPKVRKVAPAVLVAPAVRQVPAQAEMGMEVAAAAAVAAIMAVAAAAAARGIRSVTALAAAAAAAGCRGALLPTSVAAKLARIRFQVTVASAVSASPT